MLVKSAVPHPPPIVFDGQWMRSGPIIPKELRADIVALQLWVQDNAESQYHALMAIASCPNLRTLTIGQGIYHDRRGHPPDTKYPWPSSLCLPHLHTLSVNPQLSPRLMTFLLSNSPNIERFSIRGVISPPLVPMRTTAQAPNLRTLNFGSYPFSWLHQHLNLPQLSKLSTISGNFHIGEELRQLLDIQSLRRLHANVLLLATGDRPKRSSTELDSTLSALPRPHEVTLPLKLALPMHSVDLAGGTRIVTVCDPSDIDALLISASQYPRTLRVMVLNPPLFRAEETPDNARRSVVRMINVPRPSTEVITRLKEVFRERRILFRLEAASR